MLRSGSSAKMGMAATSWNSRMENPAWPLDVRIRFRSRMICKEIAVDDSPRPSPATNAVGQATPKAIASPVISAAPLSIWAVPQPKMGRRKLHKRPGCSSSPIRKSINTTPNSAK